jgi:hypothetical protein
MYDYNVKHQNAFRFLKIVHTDSYSYLIFTSVYGFKI